jgi:hypothetical protein
MGNREYYEKKLEFISSIEDSQIKKPHHIPIAVYIQEAENLYHWAQQDKDALIAAGLAWELMEDLPQRCGALIEAEAQWQNQRDARKKSALEWDKQSPIAYRLRKQLLKTFHFALKDHPGLIAVVRHIAKGESHAKKIQDLNDLSVLGNSHHQLLENLNFDMSLLDKAAQLSKEMARLLSETTSDRMNPGPAKKIRDQAYTHLKEAVDKIRSCGRYISRENKERIRGYRSQYMHEMKSKQSRKTKEESLKEKE